jgi:hypothetical protein
MRGKLERLVRAGATLVRTFGERIRKEVIEWWGNGRQEERRGRNYIYISLILSHF